MSHDVFKDLEPWRREHQAREIGGGQKEGKETSSRIKIKNARGRCSHSIPKRSRTWLDRAVFLGNSSDFHLDHPN